MKKLSLLLFAICMSVMTWAADRLLQANPFAYDLKSEVIENGTQLKLTYSLNATAVTSDTYNDDDHHGLQIYLIDENGSRIKNENGVEWVYTSGSYQKGKDHSVIIPIADLPPAAKGRPISWEVVVHGNKNRTKPKMVDDYYPVAADTPKDTYKPRAGHGIAVDKDPQSKWFGRIFVAEACTTTTGKNSVLEYDMLLNYKGYHHKDKYDYGATSEFNSTTNYEPHRVKISDDGRMFVTCYSPTATAAVLEYLGDGVFRKIVRADKDANADKDGSDLYPAEKKYNRRPIAMDVKGSGENLKIIVAWLKPKGRKAQNQWDTKIEVYEYKVGEREAEIIENQGLGQNEGTLVATYIESNTETNVTTLPNVCGTFFQTIFNNYEATKHGFVGVAYGSGEDTYPIWMKIDFGWSTSDIRRAQIIYFTDSKKQIDYLTDKNSKYIYRMPSNTTYRSDGGFYGGAGLYVKDNQLFTGSGNNTMLRYTIGNDNVLTYQESTGMGSPGTSTWLDAFAEDYAGNLYCVSEAADNIVVVAMPYDGTRITRAPLSQSVVLFDPVPNILATDLKCTPHEKQAKYIFSFNVNTKPEGAEIRFYTTEAAMLADTKDNEAYIKYNNHDNCAYYYRFPTGACKQGTMSVELGILGHPANEKNLSTDMNLPAGKLYWNVYLKTRKSNAFAPIYIQPLTDANDVRTHYRLHATVDNNPDNDGFGHIYAIDYKREHTDVNAIDNPCALMVYSIGDANVDDNVANQLSSSTRYALVQKLSANDMAQPRRPAVAPDGMVYLTDYGDYRYAGVNFNSTGKGPCEFKLGGIWVFNPNDPYKDAGKTAAKLSRFYEEDETVSDACFYDNGSVLKLYKTNTYEEFNHHGEGKVDSTYGAVRWMNNGFRIYTIGYNQDGTINHQTTYDAAQVIPFKVKKENGDWVGGDANGSMSVRATSDGVWFCQNRKGDASANPKPDNLQNVALMFYNSSGERKFQSYTYDGGNLTQYTTSVLQSTPGAGMTISPDEKYLYVVNHEGNILEFEIGGSPSTGKTLTLKNKFINSTDYKCISTMNFDYAGNLVVTTDQSYPAYLNESTQIVVFTMPYNRDNARTIPASKSQREIPERLAYNDEKTNTEATIAKKPTLVDLYRPMPNTSYSTICLPFDLDLTTLEEGHPYKGADVRQFESATVSEVSGEKMLFLNFYADPVTSLLANTPYIIKPEVRIPGIVELPTPAANWVEDIANLVPGKQDASFGSNSITFTGVIPKQDITVEQGKTIILVADNRLAEMVPDAGKETGEIQGFRGYFTLAQPLEQGVQAIIRNKDNTLTGLVDVNGQKINIQKYLREGRIFIRVGDTLYTITGEKVGR